jgi:hypothetical protein
MKALKFFWMFLVIALAFFAAVCRALSRDGGDIPASGPGLRF